MDDVSTTLIKSSAQQQLEAFLHGRFEASKAYQEREGRQFDITWEEYLGLWKRKRYLLTKVRQQVLFGNLHAFMASDDGIVLAWKDKTAYKAGTVNATTMEIKTKEMSKRVCHMQVGEHHKPESIEKIRAARTDVPRTKETKDAISAALKDKPKSDEHKAKMAESARKRWERYRAEKTNSASKQLPNNKKKEKPTMSDLFHFPPAPEPANNQPRTRAMIVARISSHVVSKPSTYGKDVEYARLSDADHAYVRSVVETLWDHRSLLRAVMDKASGLFGRRNQSRQTQGELLGRVIA